MADGFSPQESVIELTETAPKDARVIVVGNEKGGAGKSTVSVHLCIGLLRSGLKVGAIDLDVRQRSFTRYMENRMRWIRISPRPKSANVSRPALSDCLPVATLF